VLINIGAYPALWNIADATHGKHRIVSAIVAGRRRRIRIDGAHAVSGCEVENAQTNFDSRPQKCNKALLEIHLPQVYTRLFILKNVKIWLELIFFKTFFKNFKRWIFKDQRTSGFNLEQIDSQKTPKKIPKGRTFCNIIFSFSCGTAF